MYNAAAEFFKKYKYETLFILSAMLFLVIKLPRMYFKFSDENMYFYMAKLILDGLVPYKDFYFASPPLQIYVMSIFMAIFKNLILLKTIPIIAVIITSYFIFKIVKKLSGQKQALIASVLYMFSFLVLITTDHSTGIHLSAMFIMGMVYFLYDDKPFIAGLFGSFALLTRLYAPFPIAGAVLYILIFQRSKLLKFILGTTMPFLTISVIMQGLSNGGFIESVFMFRMKLIDLVGIPKSKIFPFFIRWDFLLVLGSLFFCFIKKKEKYILPLTITFFLIVFYAFYSDLYYLYLGLLVPFLAIFTAHSLFYFKKFRHFNYLIASLLIFIIIFNTFYYIRDHSETARITFINEITDFIRENSREQDTIYGSFEITPLAALISERKITNNFADTNPKNFITDTLSIKERTEKMKDDIKFIITKVSVDNKGNILGFESFVDMDFIKTCNISKHFPIEKDYFSNAVIIWDCGRQT